MCLKSLRHRNSFRGNMFYTLVIIKLKKQGFDFFNIRKLDVKVVLSGCQYKQIRLLNQRPRSFELEELLTAYAATIIKY